jgi:hypothetical protein
MQSTHRDERQSNRQWEKNAKLWQKKNKAAGCRERASFGFNCKQLVGKVIPGHVSTFAFFDCRIHQNLYSGRTAFCLMHVEERKKFFCTQETYRLAG